MPKNKPLCLYQRSRTLFRLLVCEGETESYHEGFDFVVDCTGSYRKDFANWAGVGGLPAPGERKLRDLGRIWSTIPDVLGTDRVRFEGRRVMVVGAGMSAVTALRNLKGLAKHSESTNVLWLTRSNGSPFEVIADDVLPQRKTLCEMGNAAARGEEECVEYVGGAVVKSFSQASEDRLEVTIETPNGTRVELVDEFVGCCGYRPDTSLYSELQIHTCYASDGPIKLASTLLGASGDCLRQVAAGVESLRNPEPGFFILGHKSYGRSSAFLLKIGHEQVRTVLESL